MKKIILMAALAVGAMAANAQTTVEGSKFSDNWSITLKGGAVSPVKPAGGFFEQARGIFGLELRKQITPVFGLGVEGEATINTSSWYGLKSNTVIDHQYVGAFGAINLMNAFGGYKGTPRTFELEIVAGTGWLHAYYPTSASGIADGNSWATKAGLNINFNLGESKAWTISLKPAVIWNMNGSYGMPNSEYGYNTLGYAAQYNAHHAAVEMEAGVTYHFKNSNGTHSFVIAQLQDLALIEQLNADINSLRAQLANAQEQGEAAVREVQTQYEEKLRGCLQASRKPCEEVIKGLNNKYYIFFRVNSATIDPLQQAEVELVARTMAENTDATCDVKGYASKDGNAAYNQRLSEKRADAVKKALVKAGVAEDKITAEGEGVTTIFDTLGWNRFAECEINVAD